MPPERLPRKVLYAMPTGRKPCGRPKTRWRKYISTLAEERLGIPQRKWIMLPRIGSTGNLCWSCYPRDLILDKRLKMDGWTNGLAECLQYANMTQYQHEELSILIQIGASYITLFDNERKLISPKRKRTTLCGRERTLSLCKKHSHFQEQIM